jgi:ABC-type sugar transport system permease subunit
MLLAPALAVLLLVAVAPIGYTAWEALHAHDLRLPWLGRPFVGLSNIAEALGDERFRAAALRTVAFAIVSVPLELVLGLVLALLMQHAARATGAVRVAVVLPWAVPTVVAALVWRFMFDGQAGIVNVPLRGAGLVGGGFDWFVGPLTAWTPILLADVWKTTPFVAILLLAGLQAIDPAVYEAARLDGAGRLRQLRTITLPLLAPALVVAAAFRALDALRLFDLSYVLTGGGPGTATESLVQYTFITLLQRLRFGYGAALSMVVFVLTFALALVWIRRVGRSLVEDTPT